MSETIPALSFIYFPNKQFILIEGLISAGGYFQTSFEPRGQQKTQDEEEERKKSQFFVVVVVFDANNDLSNKSKKIKAKIGANQVQSFE